MSLVLLILDTHNHKHTFTENPLKKMRLCFVETYIILILYFESGNRV